MRAGIYIHIPFCKSRCSYCDFATDIYRGSKAVDRYVSALAGEIASAEHKGRVADTIYFGGGTPSLLTPKQLEKIVESIHEIFDIRDNAEFTLEMNPGTVTRENLDEFRMLGVNRASFGVQTFDDHALKLLARGHDATDARDTFSMLRASGYSNISFDLIAGLPNQTLDAWRKNLREAIALEPEHLSLYILEIHEGTPLAEQVSSKRQPAPDEDLAGEMYKLMQKELGAAGYEQYEISNFARPGFESKHNNKYWRLEPVFGFGVSAHSFDGIDRRWSNERDTNRYVGLVETGSSPLVTDEKLDDRQLSAEFAFLNLRLREGLKRSVYRSRYGNDVFVEYGEELARLEKLGLVAIFDNSVVLTGQGMLFSNEVFEVFV
ncbi:MAG: radical SAM family heme chaperone HemW [Acidobacteriota bacterium]|nr:radical SAM family heme chaperone HemW [Acidobacteriota bacterium]MDH3529265.1 radical SAM family heme chaperone HemW [Acidobacteriota bacterium]